MPSSLLVRNVGIVRAAQAREDRDKVADPKVELIRGQEPRPAHLDDTALVSVVRSGTVRHAVPRADQLAARSSRHNAEAGCA